jgi:hypothetical protein
MRLQTITDDQQLLQVRLEEFDDFFFLDTVLVQLEQPVARVSPAMTET